MFSFKWFWKLVPSFEYLKVRAYDESMEMFTAAQSDPNMGDLHLDRPGVTRCPLGWKNSTPWVSWGPKRTWQGEPINFVFYQHHLGKGCQNHWRLEGLTSVAASQWRKRWESHLLWCTSRHGVPRWNVSGETDLTFKFSDERNEKSPVVTKAFFWLWHCSVLLCYSKKDIQRTSRVSRPGELLNPSNPFSPKAVNFNDYKRLSWNAETARVQVDTAHDRRFSMNLETFSSLLLWPQPRSCAKCHEYVWWDPNKIPWAQRPINKFMPLYNMIPF